MNTVTFASLMGCRAVVTGSTSGIGRAIATEFARAGADVLVHGCRNTATAESLAEEFRKLGRQSAVVMADLSREIKETFKPYAGLKVVTFHKAWEYFADAIPIEIVGTIEPKPLITPSPAQVQQTIQLMKEQGVKVVIVETYSDDKLAQYIADQAGAKMVRLPDHVHGVAEADTYQNLFRYNVNKLIETAKAAGVSPKN